MKTQCIVLAGGSGFLGRALAPGVRARGKEVIILTRNPRTEANGEKEVYRDGRSLGPWSQLLDGADGVINLAGESVKCRYTKPAREEIIASRIESVKVVAEAIQRCAQPPRVWVQAGSLAIYGDAGDRWCDENAAPGTGFPVETCLRWEQAFRECATAGTRKVLLRIGFVL